ncbi:MAG TPA: CDP-alcohol phosphatidyltransferase family protein [Kofleriaceae bacterium]|nr:CDP-alcohol phosphatidyltransferase family protein [Kofleriaceae bacterium]
MDRERLQRIRNFQSEDFYPALFMRPLTILVMLVIADWKFLTPNRLTTIANVVKVAGAWALLEHAWMWSVVLLNLGILFDHLDGTVARYRRTFTKLGSFYDKASDMITWWPITLAIGWVVYRETHDAYYLVLVTSATTAMNVRAYMKWLMQAESERLRWMQARVNPVDAVAKRTAPIVVKPPPVRTRAEWVRWFISRASHIIWFEEMDLWLWLSIGILIGRLDLVIWLFFITQVAGCVFRIGSRMVEAAKLDRELAALEHGDKVAP